VTYLIQTPSFLIKNPEDVIERIGMPPFDKQPANTKAPVSPRQDEAMYGNQGPSYPSRHTYGQKQELNVQELLKEMNGHLLAGHQRVKHRLGVMGNIGTKDTRHVCIGDQTIEEHGLGVMGDVAGDVALAMRQQDFENSQRRGG
jgi:hypothetical protein